MEDYWYRISNARLEEVDNFFGKLFPNFPHNFMRKILSLVFNNFFHLIFLHIFFSVIFSKSNTIKEVTFPFFLSTKFSTSKRSLRKRTSFKRRLSNNFYFHLLFAYKNSLASNLWVSGIACFDQSQKGRKSNRKSIVYR